MPRSLGAIARDIRADWKKPHFAAEPYLNAMSSMVSVDDKYYDDSGRMVVAYFLGNANSWRGEKARAIKAELKLLLEPRRCHRCKSPLVEGSAGAYCKRCAEEAIRWN
jgi:hypothetical protein